MKSQKRPKERNVTEMKLHVWVEKDATLEAAVRHPYWMLAEEETSLWWGTFITGLGLHDDQESQLVKAMRARVRQPQNKFLFQIAHVASFPTQTVVRFESLALHKLRMRRKRSQKCFKIWNERILPPLRHIGLEFNIMREPLSGPWNGPTPYDFCCTWEACYDNSQIYFLKL